jgi:hypothetical protein
MLPYCEEHQKYHYTEGEHGAMRKAAHAARMAAERQVKAERIARQVLAGINAQARAEYGGAPDIADVNPNALKIATLAALAALNETEATR